MTRLHIVDTGIPDGPPIVWLGSIGSSTAMWDRQIPEFADRYRCILIDHPGHGASPPPTGRVTIESLGDGVLATLDDVGIDRPHIVGLSLGAMIAMSIAARHPDRVDRLVLLCTSAQLGPPEGWTDRAKTVRAEGMGAIAPATVGRWLTADYAEAHPEEARALESMIKATNPDVYASCCEAIAEMDLRESLRNVTAPTLVVAGIQDPAIPPPHAETITSLIKSARMETVYAAHLANWEQPKAINEFIRDHLEGSNDE